MISMNPYLFIIEFSVNNYDEIMGYIESARLIVKSLITPLTISFFVIQYDRLSFCMLIFASIESFIVSSY